MFWTNADLQEYLLDSDKFEVIKNYQIKITFPKDYESKKIKEMINLINEETPFIKISQVENNSRVLMLINEAAKKDVQYILDSKVEETIIEEHPFTKIIDILINLEIMSKFEKLLKSKGKEVEIVFENFIPNKIEEWQIEYTSLLQELLKKKKIDNEDLNKEISKIIKSEKIEEEAIKTQIKKPKIKKEEKEEYKTDSNGLIIFL